MMAAVLCAPRFASAKVTAAVRAARLAVCDLVLVVTPVAIVTVHSVLAASGAVAACSTRAAVAVPELLMLGVNVVVPHPADIVGVARLSNAKYGSTKVTSSLAAMMPFTLKTYASDAAVLVADEPSVSVLVANVVGSSVDVAIAVADTSALLASVAATVREAMLSF